MPYDRGVARSCINGRQGKVADVRTEVFVRHLKGSPDRASLVRILNVSGKETGQ